jgi:hypothetical protein
MRIFSETQVIRVKTPLENLHNFNQMLLQLLLVAIDKVP